MNKTSIEWTSFSANPLKYRDASGKVVWGCVRHSEGCRHCYSETIAKRYGRGGPFTVPVMNGLTPFLDAAEMHKMRTAKTIGGLPVAGSRCFLGDMTDIFGDWVPDSLLNELFSNVLEIRTDVTWQILTKRAARMRNYLSWRWGEGRIPSRHIHIGVSVENKKAAEDRIPHLLRTPAAVRFISAEPLIGPLDLTWVGHDEDDLDGVIDALRGRTWIEEWLDNDGKERRRTDCQTIGRLDQVIVGGESGPGSRPFAIDWMRDIVAQCRAAGVACFAKQIGSNPFTVYVTDKAGNFIGGAGGYRNSKGNKPAEWPEPFPREFPEAAVRP